MPNDPRPPSVSPEPADDVPWIQEAHDVFDLGTADSKESFGVWCCEQHAGLQQLRQRLDGHEDIAAHSLRYPSAVARQCWHLWRVLAGGDDVQKYIGIPADEMDAFLNEVVICSKHHPFTSSAARYIEDVERFLRQATAWCEQEVTETDPPSDYKFALAGAVWHLQFGEEKGDFSDNDFTGLRYIALLLARPYKITDVENIYPIKNPPPDSAASDLAFDQEGADAVRRKLDQLEAEIREAAACGAEAKAAELGVEYHRVKDAHNRNKTKKGKPRRTLRTPKEKAAECVRKAIAAVKTRLAGRGMPNLAAHLERIKPAGATFTYCPEKPVPIWRISP